MSLELNFRCLPAEGLIKNEINVQMKVKAIEKNNLSFSIITFAVSIKF
jgi:hypothetical protein